ncbi:MAG TPA: hypothetical protein VKG45_04955 [Actinomycetes bacterium]|nr:hypothetical protein [Actinomycetes bacterium]
MRDPRPVRHDRAPARPGAGPALAGPPATAASPAAAPADGTTGEPARTPAPRVARRPLPAGRERATALGVAGVLLAFVVLATVHMLTVPRFLPSDETPHTGYALTVGHGHLPTLDTPVPHEIPGMPPAVGQRARIYTANHPPLYYTLAAVPLRVGVAAGAPVAGFYAARLLGIALTALGVLAAAALARLLVPARPQVAVAAAGVGALLPSFIHIAAFVHNDGFAFTTSTLVLVASALVLIEGPSRSRLLALALAAAAAAGTRSSGLVLAGVAAFAAAAAAMWHPDRPARVRLVLAGAAGTLVVAVTAATSGWFYLRNLRLYGDVAGVRANLDRFGYRPHGSVGGFLLSARNLDGLYDQLWGRFAALQFLAKGALGLAGEVIGLLVVTGLALGAVRWARRRSRPGTPGRAAAWALVLLLPPVLLVLLADYVTRGGGIHARYLYPGLAVLSLIAAVGLDNLPGRRRGLPILAVLAAQVVLNLVYLGRFLSRIAPGHPAAVTALSRRIADTGLPAAPVMMAAAVLLALALAMVGRALWALGDRPPETAP